MNVSSTGNGAHNIRSINVRANLLAEWTTDQVRFRSEASKCLLFTLLSLVAVGVFVPLIQGSRTHFLASVKLREAELGDLKTALATANDAKKASEPQLAEAEVIGQTGEYFDRLIGETYKVLDSAKSGMVFATTRTEVRAAEILIDCKASAQGYEVAEAFAQDAGRGSHKISSLSSLRPAEEPFVNGISFEYQKKVSVK